MRWVEDISLLGTHMPKLVTHKQEGYHSCRGRPGGVRDLSTTLCSAAWGSCTRKMRPHSIWLGNQRALHLGEQEQY